MGIHRTIALLLVLCTCPAWATDPAAKAATIAQRYLGTPYRWGGSSPTGFDCSGLVRFAFAGAGVDNLPRTVTTLQAMTLPVTREQLRKGDLLFFMLRDGRRPHVGIYLGEGRFIHAGSRGKNVASARLDEPYWSQGFTGAGRVVLEN